MPSRDRSTSKVPMRVRYGAEPFTVPMTEMRLSLPIAALKRVSLLPSAMRRELSTSCRLQPLCIISETSSAQLLPRHAVLRRAAARLSWLQSRANNMHKLFPQDAFS